MCSIKIFSFILALLFFLQPFLCLADVPMTDQQIISKLKANLVMQEVRLENLIQILQKQTNELQNLNQKNQTLKDINNDMSQSVLNLTESIKSLKIIIQKQQELVDNLKAQIENASNSLTNLKNATIRNSLIVGGVCTLVGIGVGIYIGVQASH